MTGAPGGGPPGVPYGQSASHLYPSPQMYHPTDPHAYARAHPPTTWRQSPSHSPSLASMPPSSAVSNSPTYRERNGSRYSPYPGQTLHRKHSGSSGESPSLDMPALSLRDRRPHSDHRSRLPEPIVLPPIQSNSQSRGSFTQPPYALPPISSLEHSRGGRTNNSAEVLRRLKMDDNSNSEDERRHEDYKARTRSQSTSMYK